MAVDTEDCLRIYRDLRRLPISYKGDRHQTVCEYRSAKISDILRRDYGIDLIQKAWVSSVAPDGKRTYIKSPFRNRDLHCFGAKENDWVSFNFHVAPVVLTSDGFQLVFDPKFYSEPPTIEQWLSDFVPECAQDKQVLNLTDSTALFFGRDVIGLDRKDSFLSRSFDSFVIGFELWTAPVSRAQSGHLKANWLDSENEGRYNCASSPVLAML